MADLCNSTIQFVNKGILPTANVYEHQDSDDELDSDFSESNWSENGSDEEEEEGDACEPRIIEEGKEILSLHHIFHSISSRLNQWIK